MCKRWPLGVVFQASVVAVAPAVAQELPLKFTFDTSTEKWANQSPLDENSISERTDTCGRNGSGGIHMKGSDADPDQMRIWRKLIFNAPHGKTIRLSAWARGKGVENVVLLAAQAHATVDYSINAFATTQVKNPLKGDFEWTRLETELEIPKENKSVHIMLMMVGNGEVWFDDVEAVVVGETPAILPGVFEARGAFDLMTDTAKDAVLLLPIPLSYEEQTPISYSLACDPPARMKGARVYEDKPGNWVTELTVEAGAAGNPVRVSWSSMVLVGPSDFSGVPATAPIPEAWHEEVRAWLASTKCVQSDDERIRAKASTSRDVMQIISETLVTAKEVIDAQEGRCTALDAVQALTKKGSCTSRANLVAALLRASGVPARLLAGYPAWAGALQTHSIVEAYVPAYGWYPIESTKLVAPWSRHEQIQVSIVPPEYEDRSFGRPLIANGVPYLTLTEKAEGSGDYMMVGTIDPLKPGCDHEAKALVNMPETSAAEWGDLLGVAREEWGAWLASKPRSGAGEVFSIRLVKAGAVKELAPMVPESQR